VVVEVDVSAVVAVGDRHGPLRGEPSRVAAGVA
jgi:hypothetical protein